MNNSLVCLDPKDGSIKWKERGSGSILLIDSKLVWIHERGPLKIGTISPEGFNNLVTATVHRGTFRNNPAYADGKLYIKTHEGELSCYQISK